MGLLDKIKSLFNRNKPKQLGAGQENANNRRYMNFPQSFATSPNGDYTMVLSVEYKNQVTHRDGRVDNIMLAKIANSKEGQAILIGNEDYVAFEMPVDIPIDDNVLMGKLAGYYSYERNTMKNDKECVYIGEIDNNPNNNFINKSEKVEQYVDTEIAQQIREEKARRQAQIQHERELAKEREALGRAEFEKRIAFDIAEQKRKDAIEREQRIQNAYLRPQGKSYRDNYGKIYNDYNGININTGDILRLRKFNKVGKDQQGKYLYTGYINNTPNEHDVEILSHDGTPMGDPVCFTTYKKLEDIVMENKQDEIKQLLGLLSQGNEKLNYIGTFEKEWKDWAIDRESPEMFNAIMDWKNKCDLNKNVNNRETENQEWGK